MQATPAVRVQDVAHLPSAGWLRSTTIRVRLIVAFSSLLALLLATAGLGAWQLVELDRVARANLQIERLMGEWHSEIRADALRTAVLARSDAMEEIVDAVEKVTELIGEIAASSHEQSCGIRQVHAAVTQMDQVVQQNASLVEQASAATESMKEQAGTLLQLVSRFKLAAMAGARLAVR